MYLTAASCSRYSLAFALQHTCPGLICPQRVRLRVLLRLGGSEREGGATIIVWSY